VPPETRPGIGESAASRFPSTPLGRCVTDFHKLDGSGLGRLSSRRINLQHNQVSRGTLVLPERIAQRWTEFVRRGRAAQTAVVGIDCLLRPLLPANDPLCRRGAAR
jgi:hypothetical protein